MCGTEYPRLSQNVKSVRLCETCRNLSLKPELHEARLRAISEKTNLSTDTINELLTKGWQYEETLGAPARWIHPVVKLRSV